MFGNTSFRWTFSNTTPFQTPWQGERNQKGWFYKPPLSALWYHIAFPTQWHMERYRRFPIKTIDIYRWLFLQMTSYFQTTSNVLANLRGCWNQVFLISDTLGVYKIIKLLGVFQNVTAVVGTPSSHCTMPKFYDVTKTLKITLRFSVLELQQGNQFEPDQTSLTEEGRVGPSPIHGKYSGKPLGYAVQRQTAGMHRALRQNTLNGVTSNEKLSHLFRIILQRWSGSRKSMTWPIGYLYDGKAENR